MAASAHSRHPIIINTSFATRLNIIMQKKSIYVAYTGGTIGMQRSDKGYI
ncbi:asparaginase, partial [Salmonella enterica]|nr:asparaginase [Salmonella enterica]